MVGGVSQNILEGIHSPPIEVGNSARIVIKKINVLLWFRGENFMIARYKNYFCNIDMSQTPINIWAYHPLNGFEKGITRKGNVYYEKNVDISEVDEIFEPGFSVKWHGQWCGIASYSIENDIVAIMSGDKEFANNYGMEQLERGVYTKGISITECCEIRFRKLDYFTHEKVFRIISEDELKTLWTKMIAELIPPR